MVCSANRANKAKQFWKTIQKLTPVELDKYNTAYGSKFSMTMKNYTANYTVQSYSFLLMGLFVQRCFWLLL